jgi:hypothetical protein
LLGWSLFRLRRGFWRRLWCGFGFRLRFRFGLGGRFFGRGFLLGFALLLALLPKQALFLGFLGLRKDRIVCGERILRRRLKIGLRAGGKRRSAQRRGCHEQAECRSCQNPWLAFHRQILL